LIEAALYSENKAPKKTADDITSAFASFSEKYGIKTPPKGKKA
jgi:hypothetical protein